MSKRKKKKASFKCANLKKPIPLMVDGKEIAHTIAPFICDNISLHHKENLC